MQTLETAKRNRDNAINTYDRELRSGFEREWKLIFERELAKAPQLTAAEVLKLYEFLDRQRAEVFGKLDAKKAQWLADDSLDQCLALAEIQAEFARQVSDTQKKFAETLKIIQGKQTLPESTTGGPIL